MHPPLGQPPMQREPQAGHGAQLSEHITVTWGWVWGLRSGPGGAGTGPVVRYCVGEWGPEMDSCPKLPPTADPMMGPMTLNPTNAEALRL